MPELIHRLSAIPGIEDLALTTNGVLLGEQAEALYRAGLRRLNIHIDTLDRSRFEKITRRDATLHKFSFLALCLAELLPYLGPEILIEPHDLELRLADL